MSILIEGMEMPKEHEIIKCYIAPYKDHAQLIVTNSNVPEDYDAIEAPITHGEWYHNIQKGWHCSVCGNTIKNMPTYNNKFAEYVFCPYCGANNKG